MNLKRTRNFIENEIDKDIMSTENGVNPPAPNPAHNSNFSLLSVLGRERLTGPNYMDWMRNLRFTLRYENKEYVLDEQIPTIDDDSTQEEIEAHQKHYDDANKVSCIMASSMSPELQKTFENTWAYEMNQQLKEMFQAKASKERLDVVKSLMACKPKPGASICAFVLEMKGKETSIMELRSLLQTTEQRIKKIDVPSTSAAPVLTVGHNAKKRKTSHSNWKGKAAKGKFDRGSKRKAEYEITPTSDPKEAVCFYCNTKGHWKRSCLKYLKDLKDRKGLKESRRLKYRELNLVIGNRKIMHVTRIRKYKLMLKSGVRIDLNNYCYSSEVTRNIISFHALFKDGYKFSFDNENGDILFYSNGCFMFKASPCKVIYETVECISHNGNVILNVGSSNAIEKSKLWHSRLGHVNKKRIAQLQKDGVLDSFDFKSDDVCTSGRVIKDPQFYYGFHIEKDKISDSTLSELDKPANYKEVMASPEAAKWKEAKKSEIHSMYDNRVWNLVDTTPGLKTVGCKWIFKKKTDMDGKAHTYKARLVAKGYTQTHRINYEKTFSPVAKIKLIRIMLAITGWMLLVAGISDSMRKSHSLDFLEAKMRNDIPTLQSVKDSLGKCFAMKDLGDAAYILNIKIYRDRSKRLIELSQDTTEQNESSPICFGCRIDHVFHYVYKARCLIFFEHEEELRVTSYCDASWKTDKDDSRSQSACEASKEAIWMKNFIRDLGVVPIVQDPIEIFCDNEIKVEEEHVILKHIRSEDNPADPFTKALAESRHDKHARSIKLKDNIKF
ncbi:retrotransposon protein, putative, ty1-copia subclass [Tanacetum coccineum]